MFALHIINTKLNSIWQGCLNAVILFFAQISHLKALKPISITNSYWGTLLPIKIFTNSFW